MKSTKLFFVIAACFAAVSCYYELPEVADYTKDPNAIHINPFIESSFTKSSPLGDGVEQLTFSEGDRIELSCVDGSMVFIQKNGKWSPEDKNYLVWYPEDIPTYYACYPVNSTTDAHNFTLPLSQNKVEKLAAADYMVAQLESPSRGRNGTMQLPMQRRTAKVSVTIKGLAEDAMVRGFKIGSYQGYSSDNPVMTIVSIVPYTEAPKDGKTGQNGTRYTALVIPGPASPSAKFISMTYDGEEKNCVGLPAMQAGLTYDYVLDLSTGTPELKLSL